MRAPNSVLFTNHLSREFHSGATLIESEVEIASEATHAAVNIFNWRMEHLANQPRESWVAENDAHRASRPGMIVPPPLGKRHP